MDFVRIQNQICVDAQDRGLPDPHDIPNAVQQSTTRPSTASTYIPKSKVERLGESAVRKWSDRDKTDWFDQPSDEKRESLHRYLTAHIPNDEIASVFEYMLRLPKRRLTVNYVPCIGIHSIVDLDMHTQRVKNQHR